MPSYRLSAACILSILSLASVAYATPHFDTCSTRTGNNATIIVPAFNVSINDSALGNGDEIAVFTPDGVCAGLATFENNHLVLAAWKDNPLTQATDGFAEGETLMYAVWDASADIEYGRGLGEVYVSYNQVIAEDELFETDGIYVVAEMIVSPVTSNEGTRPLTFSLSPNFPNPFATRTTIQYELPYESPVTLEVFDMVGHRIAVLVDEVQPAGAHEASFGADSHLASGTYIYRIRANGFTSHRKMMVVH